MDAVIFLIPGRLDTLTGGYAYDRRIVEGLRGRGWPVEVRELDASFPRPTSAALDAAARTLAAIPSGATVMIDGLALGGMPAQIAREAARVRVVALVHHPLAEESGIDRETALALRSSERQALAAARLVIVTSQATAAALASYEVPRARIVVIEPGTDLARLARGSGSAIVDLLCVATLIPRKGHEILFQALAAVSHRNWRLTCVGSLDRHPPTAERLRARLSAEGLEDRVSLAGEVDAQALTARYECADVFVLPTLHEGYGMAVAEALACGLPVVSTATGAIAELLGVRLTADATYDMVRLKADTTYDMVRLKADTTYDTVRLKADTTYGQAGLVVPPNDVPALATALSVVIGDEGVRSRLALNARQARERLPSWDQAVGKVVEVLERVQR